MFHRDDDDPGRKPPASASTPLEASSDDDTSSDQPSQSGGAVNRLDSSKVYPPSPVSTCPVPNGQPGHHSTQSIRANLSHTNQFVVHFMREPLPTYLRLLQRARAAEDGNFEYPELLETFLNVRRHIRTIRQRAHCGVPDPTDTLFPCQVHHNIPGPIKLEILGADGQPSVLDLLLADIDRLERANWPYKDCMRFIAKFMQIVDYITYRCKTEPEVVALDPGLLKTPARIHSEVRAARKARFGQEFGCAFPIYPPKVTMLEVYNGALLEWPYGGWTAKRLEQILEVREIILLPSYNPLDATFFTCIRQVPMFMIGLIDLEYLRADRDYQSPLQFMDHDCFHVFGTFAGKPQQYHTLLYRIAEIQRLQSEVDHVTPSSLEEILAIWDENAKVLAKQLATVKDKNLVEALHLLLFMLVHEPVTNTPGLPRLQEVNLLPALMDPHALYFRLTDGPHGVVENMIMRIKRGEFGDVEAAVVDRLGEASQWILANLHRLTEDPGRGRGLYTRNWQDRRSSANWGSEIKQLPKE